MKPQATRERVLFVAPTAYPLGGLATWLDMLMPGLAEHGWDVVLGLTSGKFHDADAYLAIHPWSNVARIESPTGSAEGRVRAAGDAIARVAPGIVASVNVPDCLEAAARAGGDLRGVMTLHGIQEDLVAETARIAGRIDGVICTNRLACELVKESSGLPAERVRYAPYGVTVPPTLPARQARSGALRLLHAGRLEEEQKRVFDLPRILEELDRLEVDWSLRVAGAGPDEGELRRRLAAMPLAGRVELLGEVARDLLLAELLPDADALLVTSRWETGPIVAWEAMAAGVPVVSSRYVGSGREASLRHEHNCLLFPVGDAAAAAREIARLRDDALWRDLRREAFSLVSERYSRAASARAWDAALRAIRELPRASRVTAATRPPAGRLDRVIGPRAAETARALLGRRFEHREPGGEWPHSYGGESGSHFWSRAAAADAR